MASKPKYRARRCQALDGNANKCYSRDTKPVEYHGDDEIYGYEGPMPTWVTVYLCRKHRKPEDREQGRER